MAKQWAIKWYMLFLKVLWKNQRIKDCETWNVYWGRDFESAQKSRSFRTKQTQRGTISSGGPQLTLHAFHWRGHRLDLWSQTEGSHMPQHAPRPPWNPEKGLQWRLTGISRRKGANIKAQRTKKAVGSSKLSQTKWDFHGTRLQDPFCSAALYSEERNQNSTI